MSRANETAGISLGILFLLGMHFIGFWLIYLLIIFISIINSSYPTALGTYLTTEYRFLLLLAVPGLSQLFYVIPLVFWLKRRQRWGLMKGVIIGAVITALLNGSCWILLTSTSS